MPAPFLPPSPPSSLAQWLGLSAANELDLHKLVTKRLPTSLVASLRAHGLTEKETSAFVIPRRTLAHRVAAQEPLTVEESDRLLRVARVLALAETVFGSREKAWRWLRKEKHELDERKPIDILDTDIGARLIEEMLYRIDDGIFA